MTTEQPQIEGYYDALVGRKLKDFVNGNKRVDTAWDTVTRWAGSPEKILEIGCGVGGICWRMVQHFPSCEVTGLDFSAESISTAGRVFKHSHLRFEQHDGTRPFAVGRFDLIVMMDVFEHVAVDQRAMLSRNLSQALEPDGRVVLTFPTPVHLDWLREHCPSEIQPIDEDVTLDVMAELAAGLECEVLLYQVVDVWRRADYAHAVIGRTRFPIAAEPAQLQSRFQMWRQRKERRVRQRLVRDAGFGIE